MLADVNSLGEVADLINIAEQQMTSYIPAVAGCVNWLRTSRVIKMITPGLS